MEYFTFGMKNLRVTQSYNGTTSHKPHWYNSKNYADYPIDIAGKDSNKDIYYATVDMKVTAIKGKGNSTTNTIWLTTTNKVATPSGNMNVFIMLTHWNDSDAYVSKLKVGDIVKKGDPICEEGMDGATANHLHVVIGNSDKGVGNGLLKNSNGKWVSNGYCMKPEQLMYIDKDFTNVINTNDITFKEKPKEEIDDFLSSRGYLKKGDSGSNIEKICKFMYDTFPAYATTLKRDKKNLLGNYFGDNLEAWIKEFQKRTGLEQDGCIGPKTLAKLKEYDFSE